MYSFEWMIGVALVALAGGLGLGALLGQSMASSRKVKSLQEELEASRQAHTDYRSEVYDQFSETARKFERLNETYRDLHQQLASSAVALLGDNAGTPLLRGPNPSDQVIDAEVTGIPEVGAASNVEPADADGPSPEAPSANATELAATQGGNDGLSDALADGSLPAAEGSFPEAEGSFPAADATDTVATEPTASTDTAADERPPAAPENKVAGLNA